MKTYINQIIVIFVVPMLFLTISCLLFSCREANTNFLVDCVLNALNINRKCHESPDNSNLDNGNLEICDHCGKGFDRSKEFRMHQDTDPDFAKYRNYCQKCFSSTAKREIEIYEPIVESYELILGESLR